MNKCYFIKIIKLKIFLLLFLYFKPSISPSLPEYPFISCFSCASEEYEKIFQNSKNSALFGRPLLFNRLCDTQLDLNSLSPSALVSCDTACISILEPQFFGGVQNERRPFSFVRGCASDIFELAINKLENNNNIGIPAEIEYLHRVKDCIELPIGKIWPLLEEGEDNSNRELVKVCSCDTDECNNHDDITNNSNKLIINNYLIINIIILIFCFFNK